METKTILKLIAPFLLLIFSACYNVNKNSVVKPDNFLNEEKMVGVLTDIQIVEGVLNYERTKRIDVSNLKEPYYNQVFLKYNITASDFKQNMDYYNSSPEKIGNILDKVLENLNQMQGKLEKKVTDKKIVDSLRSVFIQDSIKISDSISLKFTADSLMMLDSLSAND